MGPQKKMFFFTLKFSFSTRNWTFFVFRLKIPSPTHTCVLYSLCVCVCVCVPQTISYKIPRRLYFVHVCPSIIVFRLSLT